MLLVERHKDSIFLSWSILPCNSTAHRNDYSTNASSL